MRRLFILIPVVAVLLGGCNVLDTTPLSSVTTESYFKTETDLMMFSNNFYSYLLYCSYSQQDDCVVDRAFSNIILGGQNRSVPATGNGWTWTILRKMNTLLKYVDQCDDEDAVIKYTAITRFFRAMFYFEKVRYFGDVPWYETELESDDPDLYKPRDTREYVMTKMLEDIDYAIENLGDPENVYRVGKWAALALKSRFCLYEGTYRKYHGISYDEHDYNYYLQQAADAAYQCFMESPHVLYSTGNPTEDYMMLFASEDVYDIDNREYILAIDYDTNLELFHSATARTLSTGGGSGPGLTRKFVNTYLMKDGSRFTDKTDWATQTFETETADRDPRLAQSMRTQGYHRIGQTPILTPEMGYCNTGYQPLKFVQNPDDGNGMVDRSERSNCDLPVFRLAEVYLDYAEAKAELGTLTQNDLDISLNLLRDRVDMPHLSMADANSNPDWYLESEEYGYRNVTGANKGVILEIRRERGIELIQEGNRLYDLFRWKEGLCLNQDLVGMYFPGEGDYDLDGDGVTDTVLYLTTNNSTATTASAYQINVTLNLTGDTSGNVDYHKYLDNRYGFNEDRDYLYPIPSNERALNPNLTQNPGWEDGLSF